MRHRQTGSATRIEDLCWQLEVSDATFIRQIVNLNQLCASKLFRFDYSDRLLGSKIQGKRNTSAATVLLPD